MRLDREELLGAVVLLGSIPFSVALLGVLLSAFSGFGTFSLVAPFIPPFAAALTIGEQAFPTALKREIVQQTFVATFCTVAAFLACQILLAEPPAQAAGIAGVVGLGVYVAGAVMVVRDKLRDERLWPAVGAVSAVVFWLLAALLD